MRSSYQLLICTMYRLCCGYEWELFTLLVTMWLTLPRPFAGRFHGSSGAWNSALVVKAGLSVLKWEPWGMCASRRITAQRSCFFFVFGHGSSLESMCLTVMGAGRLFSKQQRAYTQKSMKREGEWLPVSNLAWSSELHCQGPPSPTSECRRAPSWVFNGVVLPSAGICGPNTQTQILTHDVTLECCCDVFKVDLWGGLSILCHTQHLQHTKTSFSRISIQICHTVWIKFLSCHWFNPLKTRACS